MLYRCVDKSRINEYRWRSCVIMPVLEHPCNDTIMRQSADKLICALIYVYAYMWQPIGKARSIVMSRKSHQLARQ